MSRCGDVASIVTLEEIHRGLVQGNDSVRVIGRTTRYDASQDLLMVEDGRGHALTVDASLLRGVDLHAMYVFVGELEREVRKQRVTRINDVIIFGVYAIVSHSYFVHRPETIGRDRVDADASCANREEGTFSRSSVDRSYHRTRNVTMVASVHDRLMVLIWICMFGLSTSAGPI